MRDYLWRSSEQDQKRRCSVQEYAEGYVIAFYATHAAAVVNSVTPDRIDFESVLAIFFCYLRPELFATEGVGYAFTFEAGEGKKIMRRNKLRTVGSLQKFQRDVAATD